MWNQGHGHLKEDVANVCEVKQDKKNRWNSGRKQNQIPKVKQGGVEKRRRKTSTAFSHSIKLMSPTLGICHFEIATNLKY